MESSVTSDYIFVCTTITIAFLFVTLLIFSASLKEKYFLLKKLVIKNCMISLIYKTEAKIEEKKIFEFVAYFFTQVEKLKFKIDLNEDGEYFLLNKDDGTRMPITSEMIESFQDFMKTQELKET